MTTMTIGPAGLNMNDLDLSGLMDGTIRIANSTTYQLALPDGEVDTFTGVGFAYNSDGLPVAGTITAIAGALQGQTTFQLTGLNVAATTFLNWAANSQTVTALQTMLSGADSITAAGPSNRLYGLGGDDTMTGGSGADYLDVGVGSNFATGGDGNDTLVGVSVGGHDTLYGADGADSIVGGAGEHVVNGNLGADTIVGRSTVGDLLNGGQGSDIIDARGSTAYNIINGNLGNDTVSGGSGGNFLRGGQGDDIVTGGSGADWIAGDLGVNTITGGQGADTFHASAGTDYIGDFSTAQGDRLEIAAGVTYQTSQVGADVHVDLANGGHVIIRNVQLAALPSGWIIDG